MRFIREVVKNHIMIRTLVEMKNKTEIPVIPPLPAFSHLRGYKEIEEIDEVNVLTTKNFGFLICNQLFVFLLHKILFLIKCAF